MRIANLTGVLSEYHIPVYYLLLFSSSSIVLVLFLCIISFVCTGSGVNIWLTFDTLLFFSVPDWKIFWRD